MPAASMVPIMLVEHAITVEKAGVVGSMPASISTSRAMLLHIRLGTTAPHTAKSGLPPFSRPTMWRATGTDSSMASRPASAPSTLAKGVRTPDANQTSTGRGIGLCRLLERRGDVAGGDAAQVAHLGGVERPRAMHGAAIVPDHQVAPAPLVAVHELA